MVRIRVRIQVSVRIGVGVTIIGLKPNHVIDQFASFQIFYQQLLPTSLFKSFFVLVGVQLCSVI